MSSFRFILGLALALTAAAPVVARGDGSLSEQDEARQAVQGGAIRPLNEILARLSPEVARDIVRVKLERRDGRWLYELRHVDSRGRMSEIVVDAATGVPVAETDD